MGTTLTYYDRQKIEFWLRLKLKSPAIADKIGKERSVVWREIKRNKGEHMPYIASHAQYFATRRAKKTNKPKLMKNEALHDYVVWALYEGWSPEQIEGRLKTQPPKELKGATISYEAIYQYIYDHEPHLYHQLRRAKPARHKQRGRQKRVTIPYRTSIHERPVEINQRIEAGHFESDSMVGKGQKQGLSVQYERKIQLVRMAKIQSFAAIETKDALIRTIETLPSGFTKSLTFDNGGEGAKHHELAKEYQLQTYFCDPYKAWQKGGVENMNGLIRQYFPKTTRFEVVPDEQVRTIQERLNNRPRKGLDYKTPNELLTEYKLKMLH